MNEFKGFLDACVLAPMPLCDTLLRLAETPALYIPRWSADILEEMERTLIRFGYQPEQAARRRGAMVQHFPEADVRGYKHLLSEMTNDPKDRHVLAAAVVSKSDAIITFNVRHFLAPALAPFGMGLRTPDQFLVERFRLAPDLFMRRLEQQAAAYHGDLDSLLTRLEPGAPHFATLVHQHKQKEPKPA